ncbi:cytochrome c biogenesis protein CcsA [Geotalea sp. SG265]|uniref:cytochrome c biogenesis protein CcsA n=1 Tax=Geotalea sp. SG265 TaxID=2922867 RepID=UPI001FAE8B8E|nr:cytochrome c biogenesis protein CcsA [Geotalea sp. SG265]
MSKYEAIFVWLAIAFYGITSALYIYAYVFKKERVIDKVIYPAAGAFLIQTAAIAARYMAVGNLPWAGDYEDGLAGSWFIMAFTLVISLRNRHLRGIGVGTIPMSLLLLGYGVMRSPQLVPMSVSLKSYWLVVHVLFAWLAFSSYVIAFGLSIMYLLKEKNPLKGAYQRFPDFPMLDDLMFKYLVFGFITDAIMIVSGAIWARNLWGNYWSWDPVETWSLVTWLTYGMAIHLRVTLGWRGRRLAWILIFALSGMIITYFGINLLVNSSLHMFNVQPN